MIAAVILVAADMSGTYTGSWNGASGASGSFRMVLKNKTCEVTFGLGDTEIKTKVTQVRIIKDTDIQVTYEFDLGGNRLESTINGKLSRNTLEGTYKTMAVGSDAHVDQGEWKASRQ
jgi:hypothetical protein